MWFAAKPVPQVNSKAGRSRGTPEIIISALPEHILGKFHSLCDTGTKRDVPNFDTNGAGSIGQRTDNMQATPNRPGFSKKAAHTVFVSLFYSNNGDWYIATKLISKIVFIANITIVFLADEHEPERL